MKHAKWLVFSAVVMLAVAFWLNSPAIYAAGGVAIAITGRILELRGQQ